jgi:hypothetical protein
MAEMSGNQPGREATESLCNLFRGGKDPRSLTIEFSLIHRTIALTAATKSKSQVSDVPDRFSTGEIDWFSKTSYNLALKYCTVWECSETLQMLNSCIKVRLDCTPSPFRCLITKQFIELYPLDLSNHISRKSTLRKMFCSFLGASLLITLARAESDIEKQFQGSLDCRKHINSFRGYLNDQLVNSKSNDRRMLLEKFACLLAFDFEAAVRLKAWSDLPNIIDV